MKNSLITLTFVMLTALMFLVPAARLQAGDAAVPAAQQCAATCSVDVWEDAPKMAFDSKPEVGAQAKCPVLGHAFTVTKNTVFSEYKGKFYAFCCPGCKPKFDKEPEKYLSK